MMNLTAIIVTFNPTIPQLTSLVDKISDRVHRVIVVDNFSSNKHQIQQLLAIYNNCFFYGLDQNYGIAFAQNFGVNKSVSKGASHFILFDQDSLPMNNMIDELISAMNSLSSRYKVAAVGPNYMDMRQKSSAPFINVQGLRVKKFKCDRCSSLIPVSYLIASGSLISHSTADTVGLMAEELFIDYVDIEWGLRAKRLGFQSFGVCAAKMSHDLGETPAVLFRKSLPMHSSLRHYYLFRNAIYLYRTADFPFLWKVGDFYRLMLKYGFYTLFAKPRWQHISMMTKGMWDGMRGKMGKYSGT